MKKKSDISVSLNEEEESRDLQGQKYPADTEKPSAVSLGSIFPFKQKYCIDLCVTSV